MKRTMRGRTATTPGVGRQGRELVADAECAAAGAPRDRAWSAGEERGHGDAGGQFVADRSLLDRGERPRIEMARGKRGTHPDVSDPESVEWTGTLVEECAAEPITGRLHRQRRKSSRGQGVRPYHVASVRHRYGTAQGPCVRARSEDVSTAPGAALWWVVTYGTVIRCGEAGLFRDRQITAGRAVACSGQSRSHRAPQACRGSHGLVVIERGRPSDGGQRAGGSANTQARTTRSCSSTNGAALIPANPFAPRHLQPLIETVLKKTIPGTAL